MKTLKELKRIAKRLGSVIWTTWTGLDILMLTFITIYAIFVEKILSLIIILAIILVVSYIIGKIYAKIFE